MKVLLILLLSTSVYCQSDYFRDLLVIDEYKIIVVGDSGKILKTVDSGKNWIDISVKTDDVFIEIESVGEKLWLRSYRSDRILYSEDLGDNWEQIFQLNTGYIRDMLFLNDSLGFMTSSGIYKTIDGGVSWTLIDGSYYGAGYIYFLNELCGWICGHNGIYATTDGGEHWSTKSMTTHDLQTIKVFFLDQNLGFVIGSGYSNNGNQYGIFASTINNGTTWNTSSQSYNLSDVYFASPDTGWIISDNTVFKTKNCGNSWDTINVYISKFEFYKNKSWGISGGSKILFSEDGMEFMVTTISCNVKFERSKTTGLSSWSEFPESL